MFGGARSQPEKLPVPLLLRRRGQMMLSRSSFAGVWGAVSREQKERARQRLACDRPNNLLR